MKTIQKKCRALVLFLLVLSFVLMPSVIAEAPLAQNDACEELIPLMANNCRYNHYEVTSTWSNGNIQTITYWVVDAQGNRVGTNTWTTNYPESGEGILGPQGTPGGFNGCFCPNCR